VTTSPSTEACVVVAAPWGEARPALLRALVTSLQRAGWVVVILDASAAYDYFRGGRPSEEYQGLARETGARYELLPADDRPPPMDPIGAVQGYHVDRWLRRGHFGLVIGDLLYGSLFVALSARRAGVAHVATVFAVLACTTVKARLEQREQLPSEPVELVQDFLEANCVAQADWLLEADAVLAQRLRQRGWSAIRAVDVTGWERRDAAGDARGVGGGFPPAASSGPPPAVADELGAGPLVSVCLVHHERPVLLQQAVASLEAQTYQNFEVILVDDGSRTPAALAALDALEPRFQARGWRVVWQPNAYLGAARNRAAALARGEYLLFMDDDNVAYPQEVAVFVRAALRTGADLLTCYHDAFRGLEAPARAEEALYRLVVSGGPLVCGLFTNCFGDANALVRREAFLRVGGFAEQRGFGAQDHELFVRMGLAGCRMAVVPEALYAYRVADDGMRLTVSEYRNATQALAPYRQNAPAWLIPYLDLAPGWRRQLLEKAELFRRTCEMDQQQRTEAERHQAALDAVVAERDELAARLRVAEACWPARVAAAWRRLRGRGAGGAA